MAEQELVAVTLARMEVKLDQALSGVVDHEQRLRLLEGKGFIAGRQLWAGLLGSCAVATCVATVLAVFVH